MIVLAVLLLVVVVAVVVFVLLAGADQQVTLASDLLNLDWRPSVLVVFLLGALSLLLAGLALGLLRAGARRKAQHRRELKRLREAERARAAGQGDEGGAHRDVARGSEHADSGSTRTIPIAPDDDVAPTRSQQGASAPDDPQRTGTSRGTWHDDPDGGTRR